MGLVEDNEEGTTYFVYERYTCTFENLTTESSFVRIVDGRVSSLVQQIIRDILAGVEYLHSEDMYHGKLRMSNIAILLPKKEGDKCIVKLMGIKNEEGSFLQDYKYVATVIRELMGFSCLEANDFIYKIMNCENLMTPLHNFTNSQLSIWEVIQKKRQVLLKHPFLWDGGKFLQYLIKVGDMLVVARNQMKWSPLVYYSPNGLIHFKQALDNFHIPNGWVQAMPINCLQRLMQGDPFYQYDTNSSSELLQFIRDKGVHYAEMDFNDQRDFGSPPTAFYTYFHQRFPTFFMHVYETVENQLQRFNLQIYQKFMQECYLVE